MRGIYAYSSNCAFYYDSWIIILFFIRKILTLSSAMPIVLKKLSINEADETPVDIQGREGGLFSFILNIIGLGATTSLSCTKDYVEFKAVSLKGFDSIRVPTTAVTGVTFGLKKPIGLFIMSAIFAVLGVLSFFSSVVLRMASEIDIAQVPKGGQMSLAVVLLVLAVIMFVSYFLTKFFYIGFENGGDKQYMIAFKASVIEGVTVNTEKVEQAAMMINKLVQDAKNK